jgi:hypothetical protein
VKVVVREEAGVEKVGGRGAVARVDDQALAQEVEALGGPEKQGKSFIACMSRTHFPAFWEVRLSLSISAVVQDYH